MPPVIPGFADSELKDLAVPAASFIGIHNDNLLDSISDPASLWCHIAHHLGAGPLPRPFNDFELNMAINQACPGMPLGGDNTTTSEFQDIEHQPGPWPANSVK